MRRGRGRHDRGSVTVELAMGLPVLVVITAFAVWVASLGATYVRALDAAQTAARQVARGEQPAAPPNGMSLHLQPEGDLVRAEVTVQQSPPVPLLSGLEVTVRADAIAAYEQVNSLGDAP